MVYINSRGEIVEKPGINWRDPIGLIFGFFYFILGFLKSLIPIESPPRNDREPRNRIRGFSSPGNGPPPPPARGG